MRQTIERRWASRDAARRRLSPLFPEAIITVVIFAVLCSWSRTDASVIVPISETDLVKQAAVIVIGRVTAIEAQQDDTGTAIWTYVTIASEEVWKGSLTQRELIIKQAGGQTAGAREQIDGSPEFTLGERVLLFLSHNLDGSPRVAHLSQGKFSLFTEQDTGKAFAYRDPSPPGVQIVRPQRGSQDKQVVSSLSHEEALLATNGFFELAPFKRRVHRTTATQPTAAAVVSASASPHPNLMLARGEDQSPAAVGLASATDTTPADNAVTNKEVRAQFTLLTFPGARWFEPDSQLPVQVYENVTNAPPGAATAIPQAIQAWNSVPGLSFRYEFGGATGAQGSVRDGINTISFDDPGHEIDPPVNCSGVFGLSRVFTSGESRLVAGTSYRRIIEGDTVFADGWNGCPVYANPTYWAEVITHELGHVLGLGHSTDPAATMYAVAHNDGRGASLKPDDIAGVQTLYPSSVTGNVTTCTASLSVTASSVGIGASTLIINVTPSASTCNWTAISNVGWITVTAGANGTGAGSVTLAIAPTPLNQVRTGTVTIASKTLTVTQAAKPRRKRRT